MMGVNRNTRREYRLSTPSICAKRNLLPIELLQENCAKPFKQSLSFIDAFRVSMLLSDYSPIAHKYILELPNTGLIRCERESVFLIVARA